jgi:N-acetylmuramoyl-L-alanine amidase
VVAGTVCGNAPLSAITSCDGACGGAVVLEETWPTCSGSTAACGDGNPSTSPAEVNQTCASDALCVEGDVGASCQDCAFGCANDACSEPQEDPHVICIDPGYGGLEPGPVANDTTGAAVTWSLANHLAGWLAADTADPSGGGAWEVVFTRGENDNPAWSDRSAVCNSAGAERLLAIYTNAFNGAADGSETHYRSEDGPDAQGLATFVQTELIEHGGLDDRGIVDETWLILSGTEAPGAMTFVGFLDNAGDGAQMVQDSWREEVAKGFMHALQQAFGADPYTP